MIAAILLLVATASDGGTRPDARSKLADLLAREKAPSALELQGIDPSDLEAIAEDADRPAGVRGRAVLAIARLRGTGSVALIRPLLADAQKAVRMAAAEALGRLGSAEARKALRARLDDEADGEVRRALGRALARATP